MGESFMPLLDKFPQLRRLPRVDLAKVPTPLTHHPDLGEAIGYKNLWIKHDNLINSSYGGNKIRKLEFLLGDMKAKGMDGVATMGGIGTNHGLATAVFAKQLGMSCTVLVFPQPVTDHVRRTLKLFHAFGARIVFVPDPVRCFLKLNALTLWSRLGLGKEKIGLVAPGGSSPLGTLGFVNAALELERQVIEQKIDPPRYLFCAAGSCGTMAGLALGLKMSSLPTKLIGVRVVDKAVTNRRAVASLANKTIGLIRRSGADPRVAPIKPSDLTLLDDYFGQGYGYVTEKGEKAVKLAGECGVKLETTYTGKTFAGLTDFVKTLKPDDRPVLFWNTYNSVDLSAKAESVQVADLPEKVRRFF